MGHIRIGRFPKSRQWSEIVDLIGNEQAEVSDVARAVVEAARSAYESAGADPGVVGSVRIMAELAGRRAARTSRTVFGITAVESRSKQMPEKPGIACASKPSLDAATLAAAGVAPDTPLVVYGPEESEELRTSILEGKGLMDNAKVEVEAEVVGTAVRLAHENPRVRALLLECSDMPPYAKSAQDATGLPVWDFVILIDWIYEGVVKREFKGFM